MTTRLFASLSLLAAGLACGATALRPASAGPSLAAEGTPQDPLRLDADPSSPLMQTASDDLDLRVTPVVKAVRRSADSVVSIYLLERGLAQASHDLRAADGQGSGVILDESGLVITNWHVVARALGSDHDVLVALKNGGKHPATVLSSSAEHDLALLKMRLPADASVQPITLGDSSALMIGETVIAIGNPQGHANTVTTGVLSAEDRSITVRAPDGAVRRYTGLLQTDAAINQGNSGGALLDITGKLIGINNAMVVGSENIGFAIPVDQMKRVFRDVLLSVDRLSHVWLGMNLSTDGALEVTALDESGPAARAGLRLGDRLVSIADRPVSSTLDYIRQMADAEPGRAIELGIERRGRQMTVEPRPLSNAGAEVWRRIGVEVDTIEAERDRDLVRQATSLFYAGYRRVQMLPSVVRVRHVDAESTAGALGVRPGDVLLGIQFRDYWRSRELPFISEEDLADKLRAFARTEIKVFVMRDGEELSGPLAVR